MLAMHMYLDCCRKLSGRVKKQNYQRKLINLNFPRYMLYELVQSRGDFNLCLSLNLSLAIQ